MLKLVSKSLRVTAGPQRSLHTSRTRFARSSTADPGMVPGVTYLGNGMGTYGQPAPDAFARFAKAGYKSVLNLRFKHEDGFLKDEQQMSAKAGLTYANSPFGPNAPVDVQSLKNAALKSQTLPGPVLIHCAAGKRAAAVAAVTIARRLGLDADGALAVLAEEGVELPEALEEAVRTIVDAE